MTIDKSTAPSESITEQRRKNGWNLTDGYHCYPNGRMYMVKDTGEPYVVGEYPSGGLTINLWIERSKRWGYLCSSPDANCAWKSLNSFERLDKVPDEEIPEWGRDQGTTQEYVSVPAGLGRARIRLPKETWEKMTATDIRDVFTTAEDPEQGDNSAHCLGLNDTLKGDR